MQSPYSPDTLIRPLEWMIDAACTAHNPEWWFQADQLTHPGVRERVVGICHTCPVIEKCREYALDPANSITHGVWGGLTAPELNQIRRNNKRNALQDRLRGTA